MKFNLKTRLSTNIKFKYCTIIGIIIFVALDQYFKYLAVVHLSPIETMPIWEDIFHLTYLENPGAAFGSFAGDKVLLIGMTSIMLVLLTAYLLLTKIKNRFMLISLALIIAGGVGNLIDRIFRSVVIDYLHLKIIQFPIFNFADCCVVIGIICFMICFLFIKEEKH